MRIYFYLQFHLISMFVWVLKTVGQNSIPRRFKRYQIRPNPFRMAGIRDASFRNLPEMSRPDFRLSDSLLWTPIALFLIIANDSDRSHSNSYRSAQSVYLKTQNNLFSYLPKSFHLNIAQFCNNDSTKHNPTLYWENSFCFHLVISVSFVKKGMEILKSPFYVLR